MVMALIFFKKIFFFEKPNQLEKEKLIDEKLLGKSSNNLIKNLKYEITLKQNTNYTIESDFAELITINENEKIKMFLVKAKYMDEKKIPLIIKSQAAYYNNSNHNTLFEENISIEYLNNKIFSDQLELNFTDNTIKISQNVKFIGEFSSLETDNIIINLITKKIYIYMNDQNKKVEVNINK